MQNFRYLIKDKLAGSGFPGAYSDIRQALLNLKKEGFSAIISLTRQRIPQAVIEEMDFDYLHLPIAEFGVPTLEQIEEFVRFARGKIEGGGKVLVHCWAGYGRTGTLVACYLVAKGMSARQAIRDIRKKTQGYIETPEQETAVYEYEAYIRDE